MADSSRTDFRAEETFHRAAPHADPIALVDRILRLTIRDAVGLAVMRHEIRVADELDGLGYHAVAVMLAAAPLAFRADEIAVLNPGGFAMRTGGPARRH